MTWTIDRLLMFAAVALLVFLLAPPWATRANADGAYVQGDFALHGTGGRFDTVWRINTRTGRVSMCSSDPVNGAPSCTPWSAP